jgi:prepilin signal peptidase PulO-like enzyme (type II secretory pathway)
MILGGILFITGLVFGSFLISFLWRYQEKKSFKGRSICPQCAHKISWYDNLPIISWFLLTGKCRHCKKSISVQYPIVELLVGITFFAVGAFYTSGITVSKWLNDIFINFDILGQINGLGSLALPGKDILLLLLVLALTLTLVLISIYDYKTKEIPNGFSLTLLLFSSIYLLVITHETDNLIEKIIPFIFSGFMVALFFWALAYFSKETWMGGGDSKIAFSMGLILGPAGTFLAVFLASFSGSIYGITSIVIAKLRQKKSQRMKKISHEIPFGPFLALGTFISLIFGPNVINLYVKIFLDI